MCYTYNNIYVHSHTDLLCVFIREHDGKVSHQLTPSLLPKLQPPDSLKVALRGDAVDQVIGCLLPQLLLCGEADHLILKPLALKLVQSMVLRQ